MTRVRLTKRLVETTEAKPKRFVVWDSEVVGLGVRFSPNGKRTYLIKYRAGHGRSAPQRWMTLGTHGATTLTQARDLARAKLGEVASGGDPQLRVREALNCSTLQGVWDRYELDILPLKKPKTQASYRQLWETRLQPKFGNRPLKSIRRSDIDRVHKSWADSPHQANRSLAVLSLLFTQAMRWDYFEGVNPCKVVTRFKERGRERYLSPGEIARLGKALDDGEAAQLETPYMAGAVRLLLFTGARVSEILNAEWGWVDWERQVIFLPDSKTGRKPIYLGDAAIKELRRLERIAQIVPSQFIIQGRTPDQPLATLKKAWARICDRAQLDDVRVHDLRHTAASVGVAQGLSLPRIGKLLGHSQTSTTARYAHLASADALHSANTIADSISAALGQGGG